jgi:hypothetical protein
MQQFNLKFLFFFLLSFCCYHGSFAKPAPGYTIDLKMARNEITGTEPLKAIAYTSVVTYSDHIAASLTLEKVAGLARQGELPQHTSAALYCRIALLTKL